MSSHLKKMLIQNFELKRVRRTSKDHQSTPLVERLVGKFFFIKPLVGILIEEEGGWTK